jgi:hypothetical protein
LQNTQSAFGDLSGKKIFLAQRRKENPLETRQRFAPLREKTPGIRHLLRRDILRDENERTLRTFKL